MVGQVVSGAAPVAISPNGDEAKKEQLYKLRHSAAHIMAQAVLELYPEAKIAIGPPIENGFYYDFDLGRDDSGKPRTFEPDDQDRQHPLKE